MKCQMRLTEYPSEARRWQVGLDKDNLGMNLPLGHPKIIEFDTKEVEVTVQLLLRSYWDSKTVPLILEDSAIYLIHYGSIEKNYWATKGEPMTITRAGFMELEEPEPEPVPEPELEPRKKGYKICPECDGEGVVVCSKCDGSGCVKDRRSRSWRWWRR